MKSRAISDNPVTSGEKSSEGPRPRRPIYFLPGWAFDGGILEIADEKRPWRSFSGPLSPLSFIDDFHAILNREGIERVDLVGWSMGAHLALDFACRHPRRVGRIYLIAMRRRWPREEILQVRGELLRDKEGFLLSFYRKCFLGDKKRFSRFEKKLLSQYLREMDRETLLAGLEYLGNWEKGLSETALAADIFPAPWLIHGRRDIVAPHEERIILPNVLETLLPGAGHMPFLEKDFALPIRKEGIRDTFSRAARTYDAHAVVQAEAARMLQKFLPGDLPSPHILEIGCGTGVMTTILEGMFPGAEITALDFSRAMIDEARKKTASAAVRFCCEDGEAFLEKNKNARYGLVISNATMHWFDHLGRSLNHVGASLVSGGWFMATIFGPRTLEELAGALRSVFGSQVVIPASGFLGRDALSRHLADSFSHSHVEEFLVQRDHDSLAHLLRSLGKTGVTGNKGAAPALTPGRLRLMERWFASRMGSIRVTYQIFMARCQKR